MLLKIHKTQRIVKYNKTMEEKKIKEIHAHVVTVRGKSETSGVHDSVKFGLQQDLAYYRKAYFLCCKIFLESLNCPEKLFYKMLLC